MKCDYCKKDIKATMYEFNSCVFCSENHLNIFFTALIKKATKKHLLDVDGKRLFID